MSEPIHLSGFQLLPVLELEPFTFATQDRSFPYEEGKDQTNEEQKYWETCLADSGITGLTPIKTGSWFVRVMSFSDQKLEQAIKNAESELKDFSLRLKIILEKWSLQTDITFLAK